MQIGLFDERFFLYLEDLDFCIRAQHAGYPRIFGPKAHAWHKAKDRVDAICAAGSEHNVGILIDAEETWIQDPIDEVANAMMAQYNQEKVVVYNTYQMYLKRG